METNQVAFTDALAHVIKWREDVAGLRGEMIESRGYARSYLSFTEISQKDLDAVCETANSIWSRRDSTLRVGNSMGEVIPGVSHD